MFREPTVFVIGAGASAEADLPVGEKLKQEIKLLTPVGDSSFLDTMASGDQLVFDALMLASRPANSSLDVQSFKNRLAAARRVATALSLAGSIDALLESHAQDADMRLFGKLAIARAILFAESKSRLKRYGPIEGDAEDELRVDKTWYPKLAKFIFDGRRPSDGPAIFNNVSMICFNYDRCIETFFFNALRRYFSMDADTARNAMSGLNIIRPYGKVGSLGWQSPLQDAVEFGAEVTAEKLLSLSSQIRIYTEQSNDTNVTNEISQVMTQANRAVFLGFGFHRQNIDLIRPTKESRISSVLMTSFGLSAQDIHVAMRLACVCVHGGVDPSHVVSPHDSSCSALFTKASLALKN